MVTRDTPWPDGTPSWVDLGTSDIPKAIAFYSRQFGWDVEPGGPEMGGYSMARLGGRNVAGIGPIMGPPGTPSAWTTYFASADVDATAARIANAGGQILSGPMDVMEQGRLVVAADVTGAVFGVWQGRKHTGIEVANVPGAFTWSEHMSRDFEGAKAFYAAVFGYEYGDMSSDGFSYATMLINGQQVVGGIGAFPAGQGDDQPAQLVGVLRHLRHRQGRRRRDRQRRPGGPPRRRQPLRPDGRRRRRRGRGLQPHLHPRRRQ